MVESTDGFYIAEMDLKLRGPGEFFGTKQSGLPALRIANIIRDKEVLELARSEAQAFIGDSAFQGRITPGGDIYSRTLAAALRPGAGGLIRVIQCE